MSLTSTFQLPTIVRQLLYNVGIQQFVYRFKSSEYLILFNDTNPAMFFTIVLDNRTFAVKSRRLRNNINILVVDAELLELNPELATEQIESYLKDSFTEYSEFPTTALAVDNDPAVDVGEGIYPWPTRVFSPYVDTTAWPTYLINDQSLITGVMFYNLGFIVSQSATNCIPTWGTFYVLDALPGLDQIKLLRARGGDVTVSFGGAANVPLHVCASDAITLADIYYKVVDAFNLTRIDFDIEGAWVENTEANMRNSAALKMLQDRIISEGKNLDIWFTLPILQTGLTPAGLNIITLARNAGVTVAGVNAMTMDYGPPIDDMAQAGIDAINALNTQLGGDSYTMIGTTPMLGRNDVQGETFTLDNARTTLTFAEGVNLAQVSMWSSNRDNSQASGIQQTDNEFAGIFVPYTNS